MRLVDGHGMMIENNKLRYLNDIKIIMNLTKVWPQKTIYTSEMFFTIKLQELHVVVYLP